MVENEEQVFEDIRVLTSYNFAMGFLMKGVVLCNSLFLFYWPRLEDLLLVEKHDALITATTI